jgi:NAD(P)H-flavin reductase/hemoglobin-like flavoprotein
VAIALDGGVPDYSADRLAGQSRPGIFKRQRDGAASEQPSLAEGDRPPRPGPLDSLAQRRYARTESIAASQAETPGGAADAAFDARLVKESFAHVLANSALAMEYFYSHLFTASPEMRAMFPMDMSQMRERVFTALGRLVWSLDAPEQLAAYLGQLGQDHRKYGVKDQHYHEFFRALLETAAHFDGGNWSAETESAWQGALSHAARMMRSAAEADGRDHPPWWIGEIVEHDRRTDSVAVLTIAPDQPLRYRAGQYVPVQVTKWPRVWRPYSIANAPRPDGLIELHVRAVPGGMVSTALVRDAAPGDTVLLGAAAGDMTAPERDGDLVCLVGGTGLAPVKAIIEQLATGRPGAPARRISLFVGARTRSDLYDLRSLRAMESAYRGLRVTPVLSGELGPSAAAVRTSLPTLSDDAGAYGLTGLIPDVVRGTRLFEGSEAYICGPAAMVAQTAQLLAEHIPAGLIHHDPLPGDEDEASPVPSRPALALADWRESPLYAKFARPGFGVPD